MIILFKVSKHFFTSPLQHCISGVQYGRKARHSYNKTPLEVALRDLRYLYLWLTEKLLSRAKVRTIFVSNSDNHLHKVSVDALKPNEQEGNDLID